MPKYKPEFVFNMVFNFAIVVGQTLVVKALSRFTYVTKFLIALTILIILMIVFPFMIEFSSDEVAWILSITDCVLMGNYNLNVLII